MSTTENDLRERVAQSDDPQIVEQRRRLTEGERQPVPEPVEAYPVIGDVIELREGDGTELVIDVDPSEVLRLRDEVDGRAMLVVRQRSVTDNTFLVSTRLGVAGGFDEPRRAGREERPADLVAELFFFDHTGEEHRPGMLLESDAPLGHFFIDVGEALDLVAEQGGPMALRLDVLRVHEGIEPAVGFQIGGVELQVLVGVGLDDRG